LALNKNKTKYMLFGAGSGCLKLKIHTPLCLDMTTCECTELEEVCQYKYLGLMLDNKLSYKVHIQNIKVKLRRAIAILYRTARFGNKNLNLSVYYAHFQSHLDYCLSVWGNVGSTLKDEIFKLQKKLLG
jgi:hypothetical protein